MYPFGLTAYLVKILAALHKPAKCDLSEPRRSRPTFTESRRNALSCN